MATETLAAPQPTWRSGLFSPSSLLFALTFFILPNLPFLVMAWFITPSRLMSVPLYLCIGLLAIRTPLWIAAPLIILAVIADVLLLITQLFDMHPFLLLESMRYVGLLDLDASALYGLAGACLVTTTGAMIWILSRYRQHLRDAPLMLISLLVISVVLIESTTLHAHKKLAGFLRVTTEFDSAINRSGVTWATTPGKGRNILVVMVEGLGAPVHPEHQAALVDLLKRPGILEKYNVQSGTSPYVGSTTAATLREFCNVWGDYTDVGTKPGLTCLPQRYRALGMETIAIHGFTGKFFNRFDWYPDIGFDQLMFAEQMIPAIAPGSLRGCGITFRGLCDSDVGGIVEKYLKQPTDEGRFLYWLTLNSHMPFDYRDSTRRFNCDPGGGIFGDKHTCWLFEIWADVFDRVAGILDSDDLPPTDVLIIGDHHTPLFTRKGRALFKRGEVAWISLNAKE